MPAANLQHSWTSPWPPKTKRSETSCAAWLDEHLPPFLASEELVDDASITGENRPTGGRPGSGC